MCHVRRQIVSMVLCCMAIGSAHGQTPMAPPSRTPAVMDELLAPIALYPDALIIQIVQCASSPFQVREVSAWLKENPDLKGTAAQDGAMEKGYDASFVAIVLFPDVLFMMAQKPDWTRSLGEAFTTDRDGVFASIQRLRAQAQKVGNLKTNEQQQVEQVALDSGQQVIVIQPANPQVVYVPVYNPQVVYTQPVTTTTVVEDDSGDVLAAGLIGFTAGVIVGAVADDDDDHFYYGYGGWGHHGGICYPGGYEDFYDHRDDMAEDYYQYRKDMADKRKESQSDRQKNRSDAAQDRQDRTSENRADRTEQRTDRQATRTDTASRQSAMTEARSVSPTNRQATYPSSGGSRGYYDSSQSRARTSDTAFSGYQRGSVERTSSQRGYSSMGDRGGGGGARGGGGGGARGGGGGRR